MAGGWWLVAESLSLVGIMGNRSLCLSWQEEGEQEYADGQDDEIDDEFLLHVEAAPLLKVRWRSAMHAIGVIIGDIPPAIETADQVNIFFTFFHHSTQMNRVPINSITRPTEAEL
ncbi:hypothetical protein [Thiohalomonas denitrificans]|uniref:Uncharacterized protein n=1 Tax=Thiohalomonas denitrificans TaxID=415747 RepID=A0A1G5QP03_9GAMM|nr:hypothetical protein [Thiohalomonas denitrificans]SCZ63565.1 hypothetical protein SAMN03097708_02502 [Thiohalomonas denitrificans]